MNPLKRKIQNDNLNVIASRLACRKYDQQIKDVSKALARCGTQAYMYALKGQLSAVSAIPDGWLPQTAQIDVRFVDDSGKAIGMSIASASYRSSGYKKEVGTKTTASMNLEKLMAIPSKIKNNYTDIHYKNSIVEDYLEYSEKLVDLTMEKDDFRTQMFNTALAYGTWFKLYEAWPEVRELISDLEPKEKPKLLPALGNLQDLNSSLGLPGENAA